MEVWIELGEAWTRMARESADPGFYLNARDCAEAALRISPGEIGALALQGMALLNDHRFAEARDLAQVMTRQSPRNLRGWGILSDALLELGSYPESINAAQAMMDLKPSLPSYIRASYLLWLRGQVRRAEQSARMAIDAGSGDPEPRAWAIVQAAMIFWHEHDYEGAESGFDLALRSVPNYPPAMVGKGRLALGRGDFARAAKWFEDAWKLSPLVETAWLLGDARAAAGDSAGADEAYALVVRHGRLNDRRTLAYFFATHDRNHEEAIRLAEEERLTRDDIYTEDVYAWSLYRAGRLAEAREAIEKANRLKTPDARLMFHEGAIRLAQGDQRGRDLMKASLQQNPYFDWFGAAEARRLLSSSSDGPRRTQR